MSDSLWPHGLQHARLPCSPPTPWVYSNSYPSSRWRHPTISVVSVILCRPFLLPPSIFPSIRVFANESAVRTRWPKYWSFSFSISPFNEHSGLISFRIDCSLSGTWISLKSKGLSRVFQCISSSVLSFLYSPTLTSIHDYSKKHSFDSDGPLWTK